MTRLLVKGLRVRELGPIDLDLEAGECLVVSGASGTGKTLLLKAIADITLHQGDVRLDGRAAESMSGPEWRRSVAMLPAEPQWWGARVDGHFPPNYFDEQRESLTALNVPVELGARDPFRVSTGERQRLAVLRLFVHGPSVVLLDEPTASLDPENVSLVEALIERKRQEDGLSVVWVSHDPSQAIRVGGRHARLHDGRLAAVEMQERT